MKKFKNKMKWQGLSGLTKKRAADTQDKSMEKTRGSASRIIELEELLANVTAETNQVFATFNEYSVANKN